jgi:ornithine cyclodeaminase/alanine dehydrogenase-like protein (mu-crystallin family)
MENIGTHIFADRKTLIVTMAEIRELLPMQECIAIQKRAFECFSAGDAVNAPNSWLKPSGGTRWMKLLAGYIGGNGMNAMGMKVLARFPGNPPGMNIGSIVALFDPENGFPLAIMDGVYFTGIRTGAGGGLSAQYCARQDSRRLAVVGSGVQAKFNLLAIKLLMPRVDEGTVFSRSKERREEFARKLQEQASIRLTPVGTLEEAVEGADIVITATNSPVPVLFPKHVQPGQHIVAVGIKTEIEPSVVRDARVIADGKDVAREDGKFAVALRAGLVTESDLEAELGDVILGKVPGRRSRDEVTLFDSSGLAIQDVACAQHVYQKARELGKGTWVNLGLGEFP